MCGSRGELFSGSEQDVLERFQKAAALESAEIILRLTADCPFLDPQVCGQVIALLKRTGADYACNTDPASWPDGLDCWAVTRETLETAGREAKRPSEREHVLSYIRHNRKQFDCVGLNCPIPGLQMERWTVDTPDDLQFVSEVARRLDSNETSPSHLEILAVLEAAPDLREINAADKRNAGYDKSLEVEGARETTTFDNPSGRSHARCGPCRWERRPLAEAISNSPAGVPRFF